MVRSRSRMVRACLRLGHRGEYHADRHHGVERLGLPKRYMVRWGDTCANAIMLILIVGFSLLGVRRELFSRI